MKRGMRKVGYKVPIEAVTQIAGKINPYIQIASTAFQVASFFGQKKAASQAQEATQKEAQIQNRLQDVQAARARVAQIREARIRRGKIISETAGANLGAGGTSSAVGGVGAVTSTAAANIGNINVARDYGRAIGQAQTEQYTAMGEMKQWSNMSDFASVFSRGISNIGTFSPDNTTASTKKDYWSPSFIAPNPFA
jgi:hypothetical protein